jgi:hypothetical protein
MDKVECNKCKRTIYVANAKTSDKICSHKQCKKGRTTHDGMQTWS